MPTNLDSRHLERMLSLSSGFCPKSLSSFVLDVVRTWVRCFVGDRPEGRQKAFQLTNRYSRPEKGLEKSRVCTHPRPEGP
ncbi:MAG: hypothetical protein QOH78_1477 [Verrucomicrobiota bacterium]